MWLEATRVWLVINIMKIFRERLSENARLLNNITSTAPFMTAGFSLHKRGKQWGDAVKPQNETEIWPRPEKRELQQSERRDKKRKDEFPGIPGLIITQAAACLGVIYIELYITCLCRNASLSNALQ